MKYFIFIICTFVIIFYSCESKIDNGINNSFEQKDDPLVAKLISMGFRADMIEDKGDYYLVEGDISISKKELSLQKPTQAMTQYLVSDSKIINVIVKADNSIPSSGVDNWRYEIQQAINDWNSINGSKITMSYNESASNPDITIMSDNGSLNDNVIAASEFPSSSGNPGWRIRINLDFLSNMTVSLSTKQYNIVHELGHCIGFRHTNWVSRGEENAVTVPGTPGDDPNSVMNGGTALYSWNGFSNYDISAAIALYTDGYWQNITPGGRLYQIAVGSGNDVWGLNAQGRIYKWNGSNNWINITPAGALLNISVGSDGTVWGINTSYQPVQWNGSNWLVKPGVLKQISVGSASHIWGINLSNRIYQWNGSTWINITPAGALKYVAAGNDGTVWGANMSNQPVLWNGSDWVVKSGVLTMISVANNSNVWAVNSQQKIFKWNGSGWQNITYQGGLADVSVGSDGSVWGVNSSGLIYKGNFNLPF
jgi:hypothetical protein